MSADLDLQPLDRGIDVAGGAAAARLFAQHVPRLDGLPQLDLHAVVSSPRRAAGSGTRSAARTIPARTAKPHSRSSPSTSRKSCTTKCGSMKRSCSDVPQRTSGCAIGHFPEAGDQRPHQQLLRQAHPRVRRHLEAAELHQPQPAGGRVGRIELVDAELGAVRVARQVDQQIAEQAVDEPRRAAVAFGQSGVNAVSNS